MGRRTRGESFTLHARRGESFTTENKWLELTNISDCIKKERK